MSSAEIADNKWELQATKPPVGNASGVMQLIMMGGFIFMFGWLLVNSVIGAVTPKKGDGLADQYKNMGAEGSAKTETPAEAE